MLAPNNWFLTELAVLLYAAMLGSKWAEDAMAPRRIRTLPSISSALQHCGFQMKSTSLFSPPFEGACVLDRVSVHALKRGSQFGLVPQGCGLRAAFNLSKDLRVASCPRIHGCVLGCNEGRCRSHRTPIGFGCAGAT